MNFDLTDEQVVLQKTVRDFCARSIVPNAARWDEEERFPQEVIGPMSELGLFGMHVPEELGGAGMKLHDYVIALEEVACADGSVGLTMASHNSLCSGHILLAGNDAQKKKYLPRLASGKSLGAWGLTEPGSGSDAGAARTRAERRPSGEWVLTGGKTFITQGSVGEIYVILASTSPEKRQKGLTAFVVEKGTPGFRPGKRLEKMGLHASDTTELILEDVVVPDEQRLGEIDHGFFDTLKILDRGRIGIGAWAVGIGRAAFEAARSYAKQRVQFGQPISEFQSIRHMLADMATELDAARLLVWRAACMQDARLNTTKESSVAKYYAARASMRACNSAVQIHGGYGYTREFPVERYLRDAKLAEIGEGTNEVQKMVIAREILKDLGVTGSGLAAQVLAGDPRAAARLMRDLDDGVPEGAAALQEIFPHTGRAFVVGVTGTPGAGKSTLVDGLVATLRARGQRVAVVAVDPSSPFSGGAVLGDRVRMQRHALDPGVFIRSLATRGQLGGLSRSTGDAVNVLDAAGYQVVLVETVGVGQDEVDVVRLADTTVVVTVPGLGDGVQALKAGILEIADVLVVNKADREGTDRAVRDLTTMLSLRAGGPGDHEIVQTVALRGEGLPELLAAVERHRDRQQASGAWERRRRARAESQVRALVLQRLLRWSEAEMARHGGVAALAEEVAARRRDPYSVAEEVLATLQSADKPSMG